MDVNDESMMSRILKQTTPQHNAPTNVKLTNEQTTSFTARSEYLIKNGRLAKKPVSYYLNRSLPTSSNTNECPKGW